MPPPSPELLTKVADAARLRAAGLAWDAVAREVGRAKRSCQSWPTQFPDHWQRETTAARARLREDCAAEAMTTLRSLLRSEQETIRRDAGKLLLALDSAAPAAPADDTGRIEEYLRSLSDAEREQLAAAVDTDDAASGGQSAA